MRRTGLTVIVHWTERRPRRTARPFDDQPVSFVTSVKTYVAGCLSLQVTPRAMTMAMREPKLTKMKVFVI
jgi:hypothetical protein